MVTKLFLFLSLVRIGSLSGTAFCNVSCPFIMKRYAQGTQALLVRYRPVSAFITGDIKRFTDEFRLVSKDIRGPYKSMLKKLTQEVSAFTVAFKLYSLFHVAQTSGLKNWAVPAVLAAFALDAWVIQPRINVDKNEESITGAAFVQIKPCHNMPELEVRILGQAS